MAGSVGQYTQAWFPSAVKAVSGVTLTRSNDSARLFMGYLAAVTPAQNAQVDTDLYLDSVTWKFALNHITSSNIGIYTIQLDGASQGTIDGYSAGATTAYSELTGLAVPAASVKTFSWKMATKNASSSDFGFLVTGCAWVRTGGTPSTPGGTDTPGYTWEWFPWMGAKTLTQTTREIAVDAGDLAGGRFDGNGNQNDAISTDAWIDAGTFTCLHIGAAYTNRGIVTVQLDGATQTTFDYYAGALVHNTVSTTTGIAISAAGTKSVQLLMATKNASSSGYRIGVNSHKWIRTGA